MNLTNKPVGVIYGVPGYYPSCYPYAVGCGQCGSCTPGSLVNKQDVVGHEGVPVNGKMPYNTFRIIDQKPYLIDNTDMVYGAELKVSESIYTRVSRTQDISCINLAATVNMTHDYISNTLWFGNLCDMISAQYKTLKGKLPVVKQTVKFRLQYTVFDTNGGNVYQSHVDCYVKNSAMHYTDIQDYFVNSYMGIMIGDIPSLTFQGMYTLRLDTISMYVDTIPNEEELNPYYAFNEEKTKMVVEHETVEIAESTETLYTTTEIGWTTQFQANMSTRIQFRFTAFVGDMPWVYNTYPIYQCLNRPIDSIVEELLETVETLTQQVDELRIANTDLTIRVSTLEQKPPYVDEYKQNTQYHKDQLLYIEIGKLYQTSTDFTSDGTGGTVAESFEIDVTNGNLVKLDSPTLIEKEITENGTYDATDDSADGYNQVVVDVSAKPNKFYPSMSTQSLMAQNDTGDTWLPKTWTGLSNFNRVFIWTDGDNIYYSIGSNQYVLDKSTSTWSPKTWNGLSDFNGAEVWTDGDNIYYSGGSNDQYVLDKSTSTWLEKTWNGFVPTVGTKIWTDGDNIYYSHTGSNNQQYVLDKSTSTWSEKTWYGYTYLQAAFVWTDGDNIYYSNGDDQYVLDKSTSTWSAKTWNGLTYFNGTNIWTDGDNIYYSSAYYDEDDYEHMIAYVLNKSTSTWLKKTWYGYERIFGANTWTDGDNIYYSNYSDYYEMDEQYYLPITKKPFPNPTIKG